MTAYKLGSVPGPTNLKIETYIQWMNDYGPLMITLNSVRHITVYFLN